MPASYTLTNVPAGGRGCGDRKEGGVYGCLGIDVFGTPFHEFLYDPPIPWRHGPFRGIRPETPEIRGKLWEDSDFVLYDWIGEGSYPFVPDWVEEARRFGVSTRLPPTLPWERMAGKNVWLVTIHANAIIEWTPTPPERDWTYQFCPFNVAPIERQDEHWPECLWHLWPLVVEKDPERTWHNISDVTFVDCPWGSYMPHDVVTTDTHHRMLDTLLPLVDFSPGAFGAWPLTHIEAVKYVDDKATGIEKAGLPIEIVAK